MRKYYFLLQLRSAALLCGFLLIGLTAAQAQATVHTAQTEKIEQLGSDMRDQIFQGFKKQSGISDADYTQFMKFYLDTLSRDIHRVRKYLRKNPNISTLLQQQIITALQARYIKMYNNFKQIKIEFPSSVAEAMAPQKWHHPTGTCNPACDNVDFSKGDLSAWQCGYASCSSEDFSACSNGPPPTGAFSYNTITWQTPAAGVGKSAGPDASTGNSYQVVLEK